MKKIEIKVEKKDASVALSGVYCLNRKASSLLGKMKCHNELKSRVRARLDSCQIIYRAKISIIPMFILVIILKVILVQ